MFPNNLMGNKRSSVGHRSQGPLPHDFGLDGISTGFQQKKEKFDFEKFDSNDMNSGKFRRLFFDRKSAIHVYISNSTITTTNS
ncbi:hypothetical protein C5167_039899 [Papaver somniferum]|uniref:Uncharacterized protein n=1 Tax=Papaver somniferum TaxID=3469 RepID=A0A4Y7IDM8_PAPSO|nr:hypothetical protein C5167_039899 [Papaver somniferum]